MFCLTKPQLNQNNSFALNQIMNKQQIPKEQLETASNQLFYLLLQELELISFTLSLFVGIQDTNSIIFNRAKRMNMCIDIDYDRVYEPQIFSEQQSLQNDPVLSPNTNDKKQNEECEQKKSSSNHYKNRWNIAEQKKYINFLVEHLHLFDLTTRQKKKIALYNKMTKCVVARDSQQCRSHHQKMLKHYRGIKQIILQFKDLLTPKNQARFGQHLLVEQTKETNFIEEIDQLRLQESPGSLFDHLVFDSSPIGFE